MDRSECDMFVNDVAITENEKNSWKHLLRQLIICSGVWTIYFLQGIYLGAPTVMIAQIRREANSTSAVSDEMSSWLSSFPLLSSDVSVLILPWLFYQVGRKLTCLIVYLFSMVGFIFFYCSSSLYHVLISQAFLSPITAAINTILPIIVSEFSSPKYRGIFLTLKAASCFWGIWISNAIGTYFYWKKIPIVGLVCSAYVLTLIAWPESPYWLAMKGRYAESAKSHRWLKGINENSERELVKLINCQKTLKKSSSSVTYIHKYRNFSRFSNIFCTIISRPFYKPFLICIVLFAQYQLSGKYVISIYAIEVLIALTQDERVAYKAMLILDGVTIFSMYIGCILSRYFRRRTLMLLFGGTGITFLYIMSIYVYLVHLCIIQENHIVIIFMLSIFSIAFGSGPILLSTSIYGEIVPSHYQTPMIIMGGLYNITMMAILTKISPLMFRTLDMHGTFLFYAISSSVVMFIMYVYLPETKDKTMQEIEEILTGCGQKRSMETTVA